MAAIVASPTNTIAHGRWQPAEYPLGPTNKTPIRPSNKLPQSIIDSAQNTPKVEFDAEKHVCFQMPKKRYTMKEWGYEGRGVSPIAASDPFPLITPEAVQQIRRELFSQEVLDTCHFASTFNKNQIRGYSPDMAPFSHALWKSPEVHKAISEIVELDLVHVMEYEIGHTNVFFGDGDKTDEEEDELGFSWHYDSYPFVLVTMLSDCSDMRGGETAIKTGNGDVLKVRGPSMGTAVVMQGRYIKHAALKAFGKERISSITSFRPKSPFIRDESVLVGPRPISDQSRLLYEFSSYRADNLAVRLQEHARKLREDQVRGVKFDVSAARDFIEDQKACLEATLRELLPIYDIAEAED